MGHTVLASLRDVVRETSLHRFLSHSPVCSTISQANRMPALECSSGLRTNALNGTRVPRNTSSPFATAGLLTITLAMQLLPPACYGGAPAPRRRSRLPAPDQLPRRHLCGLFLQSHYGGFKSLRSQRVASMGSCCVVPWIRAAMMASGSPRTIPIPLLARPFAHSIREYRAPVG
jgi:hypothetical protein